MSNRRPRQPSYRLHKPTGQAVVTLGGRDLYLGKHGTPESCAAYDRAVSEWLANGRQVAPPSKGQSSGLSVAELVLGYVEHCERYYVKDGRPTSETANIKLAMRPLVRLYGLTPAADFGPLALKTVRADMIKAGLCRNECNKRISHVARCFKWGVENELVSPTVHQALKSVAGLREGRSEARESPPVKPVPDAFVDAIQPFVAPQIWAMIELQRLTGARPGEVLIMRTCDIDTAGRVWAYTPHRHKTSHHGKRRTVFLGPRAQAVLKPWLRTELNAYLFSPREVADQFYAEQRRNRKSPMTPIHLARKRVAGRKRAPGDHYTTASYQRTITKACYRAFPHPELDKVKRKDLTPEQRIELAAWRDSHRWHPHQLRHSAATALRREFGVEIARVVLGHSSVAITETYAEVDMAKAAKAMEQVG